VQDAAASNIDGFLRRDTYVYSTEKIEHFGIIEPFSTMKTMICRNYSSQKPLNSHKETMC
jgi:hypothetical protein